MLAVHSPGFFSSHFFTNFNGRQLNFLDNMYNGEKDNIAEFNMLNVTNMFCAIC